MKKRNKDVDYQTLSFMCSITECLRPKEPLTITEWAEKHMVLPAGSNESGKYRVKNMPFQKEIMDAITDPRVVDVAVMSSAQIGKTTIILCGIGYYIDYEPATQMMVLPTLQLGERFSKTRLAPMIRDVDVLADKIAPAKSKDSDNTILFKQYPGGHIVVGGANSAPSLSSMPLQIIWMDEVDRFPESAGSEGNPIKLAEKRATSFWNKKHIKTSTPTIAGQSKIESEYNKGTMEEWCVQCPCCGTWQPFEFRRMVFDTLSMTCVECAEDIPERDWKESPQKWIAAHPERTKFRSFHLNELVSPFVTWGEIVEEFREANEKLKKMHDPTDLITFINTVLGETWEETEHTENKTNDEEVMARAEHYTAELPDGVVLLTAAVDVQDDRFEVEVKGWAQGYESWGIVKTEIYGNLKQEGAWEELEEFLEQKFSFANGRELGITATAIDTGGSHTNQVYKWVKKMAKTSRKVFGIKGYGQKPGINLFHKKSTGNIKETLRNGKQVVVDTMDLYILGVDAGKDDVMNWLSIEEPGPGFCHFPANGHRGYDKSYFEGLFTEKKIKKKVRGVLKDQWVKKSGARNEPLDLFVYNYAVVEILKPVWKILEDKVNKGIDYTAPRVNKTSTRRRSQKGMM